jgi:hypothetical protein
MSIARRMNAAKADSTMIPNFSYGMPIRFDVQVTRASAKR